MADGGTCFAGEARGGVVEAGIGVVRGFLQGFDAAIADTARREIDHAGESRIVVRVGDQAQIGQRVLDLLTVEKAQAAIDAVRHARREQLVFERPRLGVGAVEQGDLLA